MPKQGLFLSVGYGNVGQAVPQRCGDLGLKHSPFVIKSGGTYSRGNDGSLTLHDNNPAFWKNPSITNGVRVAFLATPSSGDGTRALEIINGLLEQGIPVVTAEKAALANHYPALESRVCEMGISASVGGGTRMLSWLSDRLDPRTRQVHAIVNGTLNFIMDGIDGGRTAGQTIDEAVALGYAEPGASNHLDVLNGELVGDIPKKTSILWNTVLRGALAGHTVLSHTDLKQPALNQDRLNQLIAEASARRYIISIIKADEEIPEKDIIAGFRKKIDGNLLIIGGFRRVTDNPLFKALVLPGPSNGVVITAGPNESDGVYQLEGPGAGPGPTAAAMVQDARRLLLKHSPSSSRV